MMFKLTADTDNPIPVFQDESGMILLITHVLEQMEVGETLKLMRTS